MEFNPKDRKSCSFYEQQIKAGDAANVAGKTIMDNPYQKDTPDGQAWAHGWWTSGEEWLAKVMAGVPVVI